MNAPRITLASVALVSMVIGCQQPDRKGSQDASSGMVGTRVAAREFEQPTDRPPASYPAPVSNYVSDETIHDRKIHLEPEIVLDIPKVARWCLLLDTVKHRPSVGDCKLFCETEGEGFPMVLVHGGPGATHHYFHPAFSQAASFAKVVYYDQRGCGISDYQPGEGYTLIQATDDLENLRKSLGFDRWIVLGHSYGGFLAQYYAVRYPDSVAGLVLVSSKAATAIGPTSGRSGDFMSDEERARIREIHGSEDLSLEQRVYNAFLNGDWKRQHYYKPTPDKFARIARYEWKHDEGFNGVMSGQTQWVDLTGAFDGCPIPILLMEGKWDLTWGEDKAGKLHESLPGSRLVMFEASGHGPFNEEPERFFEVLRDFVESVEPVSPDELAVWKEHIAPWNRPPEETPAYFIRSLGWGEKSSRKIAAAYSPEWLDKLSHWSLVLRVGFALYDVERYEEALLVFGRLHELAADNAFHQGVALVWQGHILDLLGQRDEAISVYQKAVDLDVTRTMRHDQYGLKYAPSPYAAKRIETPFERVENQDEREE